MEACGECCSLSGRGTVGVSSQRSGRSLRSLSAVRTQTANQRMNAVCIPRAFGGRERLQVCKVAGLKGFKVAFLGRIRRAHRSRKRPRSGRCVRRCAQPKQRRQLACVERRTRRTRKASAAAELRQETCVNACVC